MTRVKPEEKNTRGGPQLMLSLHLQNSWVLEHRDDEVLPIDLFIETIEESYETDMTVEEKTLTSCLLRFCKEYGALMFHPLEEITKKCIDKLELPPNAIETLEVIDPAFPLEPALDVLQPSNESVSTPDAPQTLLKIEALIGAEDLKKVARELCIVAPNILERKANRTLLQRAYLICADNGHGCTTYARLLGELHLELAILPLNSNRWDDLVYEEVIVQSDAAEMQKNMVEIRDIARGTVVLLDLSAWVHDVRSVNLRMFLHTIFQRNDEFLFIFRIPYVDAKVRQQVATVLREYMTIVELSSHPLSSKQLRSYVQQLLGDFGFHLDKDGLEVFDKRVIEEKNGSNFFGFKTVMKIAGEIVYLKQLTAPAPKTKEITPIRAAEIKDILSTATEGSKRAEEQLNELIGIDKLRERLMEIVAQMELAKDDENIERPSLHMRFVGNPGTGKTTVARILCELLLQRGILTKGKFYEYSGRELVGKYIGETAPKTVGICRDALGSVLFIDEAYTLYRDEDNGRDYGREALDTLAGEMENNRDKFVVIMAGYEDEMELLLNANPGLASRMPYTLHFPSYTREDLFKIFISMATARFPCGKGFKAAAKAFFDRIPDEALKEKTFSNARFVRNLFERVWSKAALRRQQNPGKPIRLIVADFEAAVADREFAQLLEKGKRRIGF